MNKDIMFYENCPICKEELEGIQDRDGFVIDFWCSKCDHSWTLEDLEYEPIQKTLEMFL